MNLLSACVVFGPFVGGAIANAVLTRMSERDAPKEPATKRPQGAFRRASDTADAYAARENARAADTGAPGLVTAVAQTNPLNAHRTPLEEAADLPEGFFDGANEPLDLSQFTARSAS